MYTLNLAIQTKNRLSLFADCLLTEHDNENRNTKLTSNTSTQNNNTPNPNPPFIKHKTSQHKTFAHLRAWKNKSR